MTFSYLIDAQTLRRSPSSNQIYFDSYASIFLVSSRTGRLWKFQWIKVHAPTPAQAEKQLLQGMSDSKHPDPLIEAIRRAQEEERTLRALAVGREIPVIEVAPDDSETATAEGIQLPRPYRRLQPPYPVTAAAAEVEAVVDVIVDIDKNGEVGYKEIARWAGFNLDEAIIKTVRNFTSFPRCETALQSRCEFSCVTTFASHPNKDGLRLLVFGLRSIQLVRALFGIKDQRPKTKDPRPRHCYDLLENQATG